jgi:hypothetical protein
MNMKNTSSSSSDQSDDAIEINTATTGITVDSDVLLQLGVKYIDIIWSLLTVTHFPDAFKLHLLILQQVGISLCRL